MQELEEQAKTEGILDKDPQQEIRDMIYSPERMSKMKQKIEKHSIRAIHKKFYTKILKQKEKLFEDLATYNDSVAIHTRNSTIDLSEVNSKKKGLNLSVESRLKIKKHPLMKEINSTLLELK